MKPIYKLEDGELMDLKESEPNRPSLSREFNKRSHTKIFIGEDALALAKILEFPKDFIVTIKNMEAVFLGDYITSVFIATTNKADSIIQGLYKHKIKVEDA